MHRVYYKDELFYYEWEAVRTNNCTQHCLYIGRDRTGFWSFLGKKTYLFDIVATKYATNLTSEERDNILEKHLEKIYNKIFPKRFEHTNTKFLKCSPIFENTLKDIDNI